MHWKHCLNNRNKNFLKINSEIQSTFKMILQAGMFFGMLLLHAAAILIVVVFPTIALTYANIKYTKLKNKSKRLSPETIIVIVIESIVISAGITLATALAIWIVLYLFVDLSVS